MTRYEKLREGDGIHREQEDFIRKFFLPLFAGLFFIGYSGLIFMYNQEYYQIFLALGAPLSFAIPFFIEYKTSLTDNEREVCKEIREARKFLEKSS